MEKDEEDVNFKSKSGSGYLWEEEYKRSWDILQEDEDGTLQSVMASLAMQKRRRLINRDIRPLHRGMIRHVYLVIDLSRCMSDNTTSDHLKPTKLDCAILAAEGYVAEFFDVNPLGSLGLIVMRNGIAERITEMSGNPAEHLSALKNRSNFRQVEGEPSLQNVLEVARASLLHVPTHGTREILIIYGSLSTCDPGSIFDTIARLKSDKIRVSVVGLAAEMQICKTVCKETGGIYTVVLNESHLRETMSQNAPPPPIKSDKVESSIVEMGFPVIVKFDPPTMCACHSRAIRKGCICPRCDAAVCDLPTNCPICALQLVSSPLLARSYHHLFPVPNYIEVLAAANPATTHCFGCLSLFPSINGSAVAAVPGMTLEANCSDAMAGASIPSKEMHSVKFVAPIADLASGRFACEKCNRHFCFDCDIFVHDILHNCPGCESLPKLL